MTQPYVRCLCSQVMMTVALLFVAVPAVAQEAPPEADGAVITVPEDYLDGLKALEADEPAFVDKVWEMGDAEFAQIRTLREKMSKGEVPPSEIAGIQREIYQRVLQLKALSEYGAERYSQNARIRNFRGNVLYDALGEQDAGVKEWLTATTLDKDYPNPYNNLGMHYLHAGRYELGFQNMDRALELDPKDPSFCFNMAQNYLIFRPQTEEIRGWSAKKIYKEAMKLSKKATKLAPDDYELLQDYAVNFPAAENFGVKANWKDAIKAWQAAREHAPGKVELYFTWLNEGRVWRTLEKNEEAIRCFREALAIRPDSELVQRLIRDLETEG